MIFRLLRYSVKSIFPFHFIDTCQGLYYNKQKFDTCQGYPHKFDTKEEMSMYRGNNPTALQSQKMIIDALLKLMEKKEFSKINIKELCSGAMVSRQTFYSLFDSKEEVIGLHLDTLFDTYIRRFVQTKNNFTVRQLCDSTITYLIENKKLLQIMVKSDLDYLVKAKMESYLSNLNSLLKTAKRENMDYAIAFLTGALMSVISLAVKNDDLEDKEKISGLIEEIITGKYFQT